MRNSEKFPSQKLIVEGESDLYAIAELRNSANIEYNFDIVVLGTITNLENEVSVRLKSSEIRTIGIVVDADENLTKIWKRIQNIFNENGFPLPENISEKGLIVSNENIKIGVWIMPNNNLNGTLEGFLHYLIPENDSLMPEVIKHTDNVESKKLQKYNSNNRSKSEIYSWLALQESPGTPIGKAINYKYFKIENPECKIFLDWLNKLFN